MVRLRQEWPPPAGQVALRLKNAPNTIIDGIAYGTITVNNLGEGTPVPSPPASGGYARIPDGTDSNNNISDITLVQNTNIYLRNSSSLHITGTYTLPLLSYTDVTLSGSGPGVTLSGITSLAGKLTINSGNLTVSPVQCLSVEGHTTIGVPEGLILESDVTSTGTFLPEGNVSGTVKAGRHISSWTTGNDGWHFLSSPVSGQPVSPGFTDPVPANYDFYTWDEPGMAWLNQKVPANNISSFISGKGYLVSYATTSAKIFLRTGE